MKNYAALGGCYPPRLKHPLRCALFFTTSESGIHQSQKKNWSQIIHLVLNSQYYYCVAYNKAQSGSVLRLHVLKKDKIHHFHIVHNKPFFVPAKVHLIYGGGERTNGQK